MRTSTQKLVDSIKTRRVRNDYQNGSSTGDDNERGDEKDLEGFGGMELIRKWEKED